VGKQAIPLLLIPTALLAAAPVTVLLATDQALTPQLLLPLTVVALLPLLMPIVLQAVGRGWDPLLLSAVWVLIAFGLAATARVQPAALPWQALWIVAGWFALTAVAGFEPLLKWLRTYRWLWLSAALLFTLATFVSGADPAGQGARLWLRFGPLLFQPAEMLRVALIVFVAATLADRGTRGAVDGVQVGPPSLRLDAVVLLLAGVVGLCASVVMLQGDFGPALIFVMSFLGLLYLATGRPAHVLAASVAFAVPGLLALAASDRIQTRVHAWLDPWADPQGTGYQSLQAIGGFASGGVAGTGPGYGHPGLIPAAHTDYPLAVIGEEWGLLVTIPLVLLYALLVVRGLARAQAARDRFVQLLGAGVALSLGVQVLIVLGGVLRLVPLTGITSPFLSYGGSSMLVSWVMVGLLMRTDEALGGMRLPALPGLSLRMRHVGLALMGGFAVLAVALGWWQVVRADALGADTAVSGERIRLEASRVTRGRILDRNGEVLAETVEAPDGTASRVYHQPGAVHVVGFDSPAVGTAGAEAAADRTLMGRDAGGPLHTLQKILHQERAGDDVQLTLDVRLQRVAERVMGGAVGAAVAIDPRSGDVLALVSNPVFPAGFTEAEWAALRNDPRSPLLNRATQGLYPPGSTFKTVTLAGAVERGLVRATDMATCPESIVVDGIPISSRNEPPGRRTRTVADALAYSCNTFFARLGIELGEERLTSTAEAFGLTESIPFALPTSEAALSEGGDFLSAQSGLAVTAFGQGELQVTPLHLALVAAAIANEGAVPEPRLLLDDEPATWKRAMSPNAARAVAQMMEHAVQTGWAASAAISGVRVAGKTGSAEVAPGANSHALFIAFAPVDNPQIAVAVVKERAGSGSREAGPVAKALIEAWLGFQREGGAAAR
jgi:cell division protein FtsI/penicillin-binding protein 2/cell division protein FtsW (lipid II flippase)